MPKLTNKRKSIFAAAIFAIPIAATIFNFLGTFSGVWSLFNSIPFFKWIQTKGIATQTFSLFLIWGIAIALVIWFMRRNAKPVIIEIDAKRHSEITRGLAGEVFNYYCLVIARNIAQSDFEGLEVKLSKWFPSPSNQRGAGGTSELPLPTDFPIVLPAKSGGTIDETTFQLFKMVRDGNVPTIEITGKEQKFRNFQPQSKWCSIEIQASANGRMLKTQNFEVKFETDLQGIQAFEVEKATTK